MTLIITELTRPCFFILILSFVITSTYTTTFQNRRPIGLGIAGVDYPAYSDVPPRLQFSCQNRIGYFADPETNCQVWHWCVEGGHKFSFLCPNSTVFNQQHRVCDWWYNVDCTLAPNFYNVNEDLYKYEANTKKSILKSLITHAIKLNTSQYTTQDI